MLIETAKCGERLCKEKSVTELSDWIIIVIIIIIIIIILVIISMHGIYNDIPDTNHVSRVHSVAAVVCLHFCYV